MAEMLKLYESQFYLNKN